MWLMQNKKMDKASAYDKARKEFYKIRHLEDVERRVAKEEAEAVGAYFGKGPNEVGMDLEDKAWDNWRAWAAEQIRIQEFTTASLTSSVGSMTKATDPMEDQESSVDPELLEDPAVAEVEGVREKQGA